LIKQIEPEEISNLLNFFKKIRIYIKDRNEDPMVYRIVAPKDVHIPLARTCEYVILLDKRNFADMIKVKILRWENFAGVGPI
jgi:hypothetical protein